MQQVLVGPSTGPTTFITLSSIGLIVMKTALILASALLAGLPCHAASIEPYVRHQDATDGYSSAVAAGARIEIPAVGPLDNLVAGLESRHWKNVGPDPTGVSVYVAGYYSIGASWWGASQVQLGSSALYPRATLYQEFNYRAGSQGNLALGAGLGHQDFRGSGGVGYVTLGPVFYFPGGHVGYKYTDYAAAGNHLHVLTGETEVIPALSLNAAWRSGTGAWAVTPTTGLVTQADVSSREWELGLRYRLNRNFEWITKFGAAQVDERLTGHRMYRTRDLTLGFRASW